MRGESPAQDLYAASRTRHTRSKEQYINSNARNIFRAIHEGKWLSIEYRNRSGGVTKYWIAVKSIDTHYKSLHVDGLHLGNHTVIKLSLYLDSIVSSTILDGTYCQVNQPLVDDINENPYKYKELFGKVPNLRILNYLSDCSRLDAAPHKYEHALIKKLDGDRFRNDPCRGGSNYRLDDEQYTSIIAYFQQGTKMDRKKLGNLALNVISVKMRAGLYVLAYRRINFDVAAHTLRLADDITLCKEFTVNDEKQGVREKQSARKFLDAEDYDLLDDVYGNLETIKDLIARRAPNLPLVDDMPYMIAIGTDIICDLEKEYEGIAELYKNDEQTVPLRAFFGELTKRPVRRKDYPVTLLSRRINLDQLLAINKAIKYPLAYIQGPPGTGKTYTIVNTIITAFFNERTVLFSSFNNHPIDGVTEQLRGINHNGKKIMLPMIRLGNAACVNDAIDYIYEQYNDAKKFKAETLSKSLTKFREERKEQAKQLNELLKQYEEILDLKERSETIDNLLTDVNNLHFDAVLRRHQGGIEKRIELLGGVTMEEALSLLPDDTDNMIKYLHFTAVKHIKRLDEPKYAKLLEIIKKKRSDERVIEFNKWLSGDDNFKIFLRVFPIVMTTCMSAHRLGKPKPYFDMVIMDEASQCSTAMSLVPILRGETLTLVGDPQQLNPVILLDRKSNEILKKRYAVTKEYDYIENSVYKTFLAADAVSDEVLLSHHYRCNSKIIGFNNQKYYRNKLQLMQTKPYTTADTPLIFIDVEDSCSTVEKNSAPAEANAVVDFVKQHIKDNPGKSIGVVTPFTNQQKTIKDALISEGITNVTCGTVHAFQGDEKDTILFSTALTDKTRPKTYDWLKNNKELINVATSRAKNQLVVLASGKNLQRLHNNSDDDDLYELAKYVRSKGIGFPRARR